MELIRILYVVELNILKKNGIGEIYVYRFKTINKTARTKASGRN